MELANYEFKGEPRGDLLLRALSEEEEKAVKDICAILNGRELDVVETILRKIRRQYSQAHFHHNIGDL